MKTLASIFTVLLLLLGSETQNNIQKTNTKSMETISIKEETRIQDLLTSFFRNVDNRNWEDVAEMMTDSVYTDYTSLGGDAGFKSPEEILSGWKSLLPGFERTIHKTSNEAIWIAGNRASATMDAVASHFLSNINGSDFWTVIVGYDMEFVMKNDQWFIARIDLSLYEQLGNTELPGLAIQNVQKGNIRPIKTEMTDVPEFGKFDPHTLLANWEGFAPNNYSVHRTGASLDSGVKLQEVTFSSNGAKIAAHLFLPPNFDNTKRYATALVTGSWTSIKEQMPDEYASLLAKDGFITMTFDFTGFGESEGQPRQVEDYNLKIADIKAAVDFLTEHPNVETTQLSGLGVCASSGYMAHAAAQDDRIKNLVLVAPWLHNPDVARAIYESRPGGYDGLIASAKEAKEKYAETGEMEYVLAASELDPLSAMYVPHGAFDYYLNPAKAAGVKYDNRFAVSSWEPWLTFDGISVSKDIKQPVFIVHSESGAVPQGAKDFFSQLKGKKDIVWLNEYNQQQLYFEADAVNAAMNQIVHYLK